MSWTKNYENDGLNLDKMFLIALTIVIYVGVARFAGKLSMMVQNCCTYPPRDGSFLRHYSSFLAPS